MRDASGFHSPRREPQDTAVILYTSGTTGHPKGAELTHGNMVTNAVTCHDMFKPAFDGGTGQNVTLITLPLFHSTAQTAQMNAGLYGGFRAVLMPRFDPASVIAAFKREQVGLWIGVPTMYWALLEHARLPGTDVTRRGRVAAGLRLGRRAHAGRAAARLRGDLRGARAGRLRIVRNGARRVVQPAAAAVEAGHRRPADFRRRRAVRRRARPRGCRPASAAKSSSAAPT